MKFQIITSCCRSARCVGVCWLGLLVIAGCSTLQARSITEKDRQHWAFQPVGKIPPPALGLSNFKTENPIDHFILARLATNGLVLAPRATKEQLVRRVTFGLVGLPPTPEEMDAFVNDASPQAYEKLIDRLLASPHYGERWGRHWLDLARFAESDGFEHDAVRPHSWRYRDYVLKSFNDDKPYDRFIREQLAGDELFPNDPQALIATSFNLLGSDMVDSADQVQRRHNTLNDMTDTMALVFLGQTLGCARCHNHKSEPFSQRDYYRMQAFFVSAKFQRDLPVPTAAQRAAHETEMAKYNARTKTTRQQIEAIETPHREKLHAQKLAKLSEEAQLAHQTPKARRTVEMENQIQETADLLKIADAELLKSLTAEEKVRHKTLADELKKFPKPGGLPLTMALQNGKATKTFVLGRGDYKDPRDEVPPGFPDILTNAVNSSAKLAEAKIGRTALADWVASAENPLTARVMVNRLWQHHFGRGLVPTPNEFGTRSEPPVHPELLDWLAGEFVARGWSIKQMQKLILMSAAYQQSSQAATEALNRDPENKLFSRQNRVRLEGEAIRDSLLAVSGKLNPKVGGPSVFPPIPSDITKTSKNWTADKNPADHARRSLYIFARRNLRFPFLEVFDAPDSNVSCPERGRSTTAPQSLTLLNSDEVMAAAKATAARVIKEAPSPEAQVDRAYRLVISRPPSVKERELTRDFLGDSKDGRTEEFCRALFNLNAFVYVD